MRTTARLAAALVIAAVCVPAARGGAEPLAGGPVRTEPILTADGRLVFPEDVVLPRSLTEAERAYLRRNPLRAPLDLRGPGGLGTTPTDPYCVPEYAPMDGLCLSWKGGSAVTSIVAQIAARVTNEGNGRVYMAVDNASAQASATTALTAAGVNMSRVVWLVRQMDSVWIRDYGPRYIIEGNCRAIVNHIYNRPRPNDNNHPIAFGAFKRHAVYYLPLVHGGGNYHLDGVGRGHATRLINNENPTLSESQIFNLWQTFQGLATAFYAPYPASVDSTQHIDMWMQIIAHDAAVVSSWPSAPASPQAVAADNAAASLQASGITVHRVPAAFVGGVHYTYTNVVMFNDIVLIPAYTAPSVAPLNAQALAVWQEALPGKQIFQINCQALVQLAGVIHCIVMHVPAAPGGEIPTAYLKSLREGGTVTPGTPVQIGWLADDDNAVTGIDILLSTDAGATFSTVVASNLQHGTTAFSWTPPTRHSRAARLKIVARDAEGNTGSDVSQISFKIDGPCAGDFDADGRATSADITAFLTAWFGGRADGNLAADFDMDGQVSTGDITAFLTAWFDTRSDAACQ